MNGFEFAGSRLVDSAELAEKYGDHIVDDCLTQMSVIAMNLKLAKARAKGRTGWWRDECTIEALKSMLVEHVAKGDMVDVMNIAAMIEAKKAMAEFKPA